MYMLPNMEHIFSVKSVKWGN